MLTILEQAQLVSAQSNWSSATFHLQQLLESKPSLTPEDLATILDLALTILNRGDFAERWDIAKIIPKIGPIVVNPLINILEDEAKDTEQRWFAAKILSNFREPEVIISLVNLLITTEAEDLKEIAAEALTNLDREALIPLIALLSYPEYRLLATRALGRIRRPEVIEPLISIVEDEDIAVRTNAIEGLSSFHDPRIPPILIKALGDFASSVRKEAVIGLGARAELALELQLVEHLAPLLQDLSVEVCQQTAIALSKISNYRTATILFENLQYSCTPLSLQISLIQALAWQESESSLKYLQTALTTVKPEAKLEIIRVLGRIATENLKPLASSILINLFHAQSPLVLSLEFKQALAHSLGQLHQLESIPVLLELSQDLETSVRLHALNAINRINNYQ